MFDFSRTYALPLGLLASLIVLTGCFDDDEPVPFDEPTTAERCDAACDHLYNSCNLYVERDGGMAATERSCRSICATDGIFRGHEACLAEAECGETTSAMIESCIPEEEHVAACDDLDLWPVAQEQAEQQVLEIVNQYRAEGANCGSQGNFGPAGPLVMDPVLRCAARLHSIDMAERDYLDHDNPEGDDPFDRIAAAGYTGGQPQGENIAMGYPTPQAVMDGWMSSDGHCSNIMTPEFTEIGIGLYESRWTQKFGTR